VEKPCVSQRSRRQKGVRAFLAQEADTPVFGHADADLRRSEPNNAILDFVAFWEKRTGQRPEELIFDSCLSAYASLNPLNPRGILFITLRRRIDTLLHPIA
jgi:hypothetical protein